MHTPPPQRSHRTLAQCITRALAAALPAAMPLLGACDTYRVYDTTYDVRDLLTPLQLEVVCGNNDLNDCPHICTHLLTRYNSGIYDRRNLPNPPFEPGSGNCQIVECSAQPSHSVTLTKACSYNAGRRPPTLASSGHSDAPNALGAWLASLAHLEAASIFAFAQLAEALTHHGAPPELVARAREAAHDEQLHAALVHNQAHRFDAVTPLPSVADPEPMTLLDLALDNAAEGCVREAFAALLARWQALHASDPTLRRIFARIADDETRHGQLALDLHRWYLAQLDPAQRDQVERARLRAQADLQDRPAPAPDIALAVPLGLPNTAQTHDLARAFCAALA